MYTAKPGHLPKAWVQRRWPDARLGIESGASLRRQTLDFLQDRFGKSGVGTATSREVGTNGWSNVTEKADLPYARNDRARFAFRYQAFAPPGRGGTTRKDIASEELPVGIGVSQMQEEVKTMARYSKSASGDVKRAMKRRKSGTLKSGRSGKTVKSKKQAIAIGLSEARAKGKKVPSKKTA